MKAASIVFCLVSISMASLPCIAQDPATAEPQQVVTQFPPPTQNQQLSRRMDWGQKSAHIFRNSNILMNFKLATSWIPDQDDSGTFRFKLSASPKAPAGQAEQADEKSQDSPKEIQRFLASARSCRFGLTLNDADGFLLRSMAVSFISVSDAGSGQTIGFIDNSSDQMDADEYRRFVGTAKAKGSWQVTWNSDCALAR